MMGSVEMFACFTCICVVTNYGVFCLNVRMFYRKGNLCSVERFPHFAFVSSQSYRGFCLNVSMFCFVFEIK